MLTLAHLSIRAVAAAVVVLLAACSAPPPAARLVLDQSAANAEALANNTSRIARAARALAVAQSAATIRAAHEAVAADLIRLAATSLDAPPDAPTLSSIDAELAALRSRLELVPLPDRALAARALAPAHPALIDLAIATPGFSIDRLHRDAAALDDLNLQIDAEPVPTIRAAIAAQRDALLDPYLPAQLALADAQSAASAIDRTIAAIETQQHIAEIHASALKNWSATPAANPAAPLSTITDLDLRAAILDLLRDSGRADTARSLEDRLARLDDALKK